MWPNSKFPAGLVTLAEEIHNGKLHFLCSDLDIYIYGQVVYKNINELNGAGR